MKEKRSWEFGAIPITLVLLGILALVLWAFTEGLWVWVAVGVAALVGLIAIALVYMRRPHHPARPLSPSLPEGAAAHVDDGLHRVLVIADDACQAADLAPAVAAHGEEGRRAVFVVAPVVGSRTARWTGDEHSYQEASKHLDTTLAALRELGVVAEGHVGSHDPLQAAEDGLREFPADEIVFAVHPSDARNWLERGVVDAARARYPITVTELTVVRS